MKFSEYNGNELRAIRRYSRSYVPHIESLKQLLVLLNCLSPQVFRPIDFIILSFFELSKSYLTKEKNEISNHEMNNWLCVVIVHIYLLLCYSSEEQILTRLHHLMPQIVSSYNESITSSTTTLNQNFKSASSSSSLSSSDDSSLLSSRSTRNDSLGKSSSGDEDISKTSIDHEKRKSPDGEKSKVESESESNDRERSGSVSTSYSNNTSTSNSSYNKNTTFTENKMQTGKNDGTRYYNDDTELDLNESALFFAKFLLKTMEKSLNYIEKSLKFNSNNYFGTNLSASAPTSLLRDFQTNFYRDLNYTQNLIANKLQFLMYMVNSGAYSKISSSISLLINDKTKEDQTTDGKLKKKNS